MVSLWPALLFPCGVLAAHVFPPNTLLDQTSYDRGDYGAYPVQSFISSLLQPPHIITKSGTPPHDDGRFIFLSPRGLQVEQAGPMILDETGNVVWFSHDYGLVYSFTTQELDGEQYLTFWSGDDAVGGHGAGVYVVLNSRYEEVRRFTAANGHDGDLHEFAFTKDSTVLLTAYEAHPFDLTAFDKEDGWIWDSIFQEIDITTGELLFEWRASNHIPVSDSFKPVGGEGHEKAPHDYYHINSIEKDDLGNYLICARYTHSITYIDGKSGEPLWILGGKQNQFKDLSGGRATDFKWQHDARWHENYSHLSIFDNRAYMGRLSTDPSRGMYVRVDTDRMEVELIHEYYNPDNLQCSSQGNMQMLPNGRVLLGYGYTPAWTEFDIEGNAVWDVHFGAQVEFEMGAAQSYRVLKHPWVGHPAKPPSFQTLDKRGYVSWNGATEVKDWVLEHSDDTENFVKVTTIPKQGFETSFDLSFENTQLKQYLRITGRDKKGNSLGSSAPVENEERGESKPSQGHPTDFQPDHPPPSSDPAGPTAFSPSVQLVFCVGILAVLLATAGRRCGLSRIPLVSRSRRKHYSGHQLPFQNDAKRFV